MDEMQLKTNNLTLTSQASTVKALAKNMTTLQKQMQKVDRTFKAFQGKVLNHTADIRKLQVAFDTTKSKSLEENITKLEMKVPMLEDEMKNDTQDISRKLSTQLLAIHELVDNMTLLRGSMQNHTIQIDYLQVILQAVQIRSLGGKVSTLEKKILNLTQSKADDYTELITKIGFIRDKTGNNSVDMKQLVDNITAWTEQVLNNIEFIVEISAETRFSAYLGNRKASPIILRESDDSKNLLTVKFK